MPFVLPTTSRFWSTSELNGVVLGSEAFTSGGKGRLFADLTADWGGSVYAFTGLGMAGAPMTAPSGATFLDVTASTTSLESGGCISAPGFAYAHADLYIFVQEFAAPTPGSLAGPFLRNVPGPATVVLDAYASFGGVYLRIDETHTRIASIHMPVIPGRRYRIWLESSQSAVAAGLAHAASNFTYDFGPLFFVFS